MLDPFSSADNRTGEQGNSVAAFTQVLESDRIPLLFAIKIIWYLLCVILGSRDKTRGGSFRNTSWENLLHLSDDKQFEGYWLCCTSAF